MPARRGISGGLSATGDVLQLILRNRLARRGAEDQAGLQDFYERGRKADELIASGKLEANDRERFIRGQYEGPSVSSRLASVIEPITKAPAFEQVPGESTLETNTAAAGLPTRYPKGFNPVHPEQTTDWTSVETPELQQVKAARRAKMESFPPTAIDEEVPTGPGAATTMPQRRYVSSNPETLTGQTFQTKPTPAQAGANQRETLMTGELSEPVVSARVGQAGREAGARTKAQQEQEIATSGLTSQQQSAALNLMNEFNSQSKGFYTVQDQIQQMMSLEKEHTPASDLGMIFAFNKILDSMGSVREGEQERVAAAMSLTDRIQQWFARMGQGTVLDDTLRKDLLRQSRKMFESASIAHKNRVQLYGERAAGYGVNPNLVVQKVVDPDNLAGATPKAIDILRGRP